MIPIYQATLQNVEDGIIAISLVDFPAVESNFIVFEEQQQLKLYLADDEQHKVTGVIMRCDFPIYRRTDELGEFYLVYKAETIEEMARRMMHDGAYLNIDLQHDGKMIQGVELIEVFIKDSERGLIPEGFDDIPNGSLFGTFKITDDALWSKIKSGEFRGFSLEGFFTIDTNEQYSNNQNMSKIISKALFNLIKFGEVETTTGTLYYVGDELEVGAEVFYENEDGDRVKVEDGEYTTEDGKTITVEGGLVTYINEPEAEEPTETEELNEEPTQLEEETPAEETLAEEDNTLEQRVADLEARIEALETMVVELLEKPVDEPVEEKFKKLNFGTNKPQLIF